MKTRIVVGLLITVVWVLVGGAWVFLAWPSFSVMAPSEWGDLLAGFFAPLAFLWLVIGYFQQGEVLHLQAEELSKQVAASEERVELHRQEWEEMRRQQKERIQPQFESAGAGRVNQLLRMAVKNVGNGPAFDVQATLEGENLTLERNSFVERDEEFDIHVPREQDGQLVIRYTDIDGQRRESRHYYNGSGRIRPLPSSEGDD